jgi:hypothetical protein
MVIWKLRRRESKQQVKTKEKLIGGKLRKESRLVRKECWQQI